MTVKTCPRCHKMEKFLLAEPTLKKWFMTIKIRIMYCPDCGFLKVVIL